MYRSKSLTCKNSSMQGFLFLKKGGKKGHAAFYIGNAAMYAFNLWLSRTFTKMLFQRIPCQ